MKRPVSRATATTEVIARLRSLSSESSSELQVLGLDGHSLGVDGGQVGVLEQGDEVSLRSLLEGEDSGALKADESADVLNYAKLQATDLESEVGLEVLSDFSDQSLEWELSDQELSGPEASRG
jgi:histone H3